MKLQTTEEKLSWIRSNWGNLKNKKMLNVAIAKVIKDDEFLNKNYSVQDIIDIEESVEITPQVINTPQYPVNPF